ncbi:MAG: uroporphyrinogen-III synthase [Paludibacteraceae bacterium]|nr:uroporphyrinogen-III synthase [Paludibacteraceae bacterium]
MNRVLYTGLTSPDKEFIHTPLIEIVAVEDDAPLIEAVRQLQPNDILLFTSRYAVKYWYETMEKIGVGWSNHRIVSIGDTTTKALRDLGATNIEQTKQDDSYGVIDYFRSVDNGHSIVFPRSELALSLIPDGLQAMGFKVKTVTAYRNVMPQSPQKVDLNKIDTIFFTSPSTIDNFIRLYGCLPVHVEYRTRGVVTQNYLNEKLK